MHKWKRTKADENINMFVFALVIQVSMSCLFITKSMKAMSDSNKRYD